MVTVLGLNDYGQLEQPLCDIVHIIIYDTLAITLLLLKHYESHCSTNI